MQTNRINGKTVTDFRVLCCCSLCKKMFFFGIFYRRIYRIICELMADHVRSDEV